MKKIDKIFGDKKTNAFIYILLAVGILLLLGGSGFGDRNSQNNPTFTGEPQNSREYQLEQILAEIEGVGKVSVMICDLHKSSDEAQSVFSSQGKLQKENSGGVLVVAEGGADFRVREKIVRAVNVALGVETHKIEVLERNVCENDDGN